MLLRTTSKGEGNTGTPRRLDVRRMLHRSTRTLRGLGAAAVLGFLWLYCGVAGTPAQTPHSITIGIPSYTNGTDLTSGFNFYRATVSGGPYTKLNPTPVPPSGLTPVAQFADTTGVGGTTYFYVATAIDSMGNESANSNEVSAIFLSNPVAPAGITATVK